MPEWKYPYHSISNNTVHFNGHVSTWTWVSRYHNVSILNFTPTKNDESGGDNWSYRMQKAPVKSSPSTNQPPTSYRPDALPVTQPTASEHFLKKEAKLMLTNLRDTFGGQSRSPNIVPFHYVRYSFLLCNSNFVFKTCFYDIQLQKMSWPWNGVKGQSRSLRVVSFDRSCMVSY